MQGALAVFVLTGGALYHACASKHPISIVRDVREMGMQFYSLHQNVCNSLIAYKKFGAPTASRGGWVGSRVHTRSSARAINLGRAYNTPQFKVIQPFSLNRCPRLPTSGCYLVLLPNQHAVTDRRASTCGQATTTHAACANKVLQVHKASLAIVPF